MTDLKCRDCRCTQRRAAIDFIQPMRIMSAVAGLQTVVKRAENGFVCLASDQDSPLSLPSSGIRRCSPNLSLNPPACDQPSSHFKANGTGPLAESPNIRSLGQQSVRTRRVGRPSNLRAMCYMRSPTRRSNDEFGHWRALICFYAPAYRPQVMGSVLSGHPSYLKSTLQGAPDPIP